MGSPRISLSYGAQQVFKRRAREVGAQTPQIASLLLVYVVVVAAYGVFPLPLAGFTIGLLTGVVSLGLYMVLVTHTFAATMGVWAEERSSEALGKAGWRWVRNLNFDQCDVDAVVATPTRLLAVETKWRMAARSPEAERHRHAADLIKAHNGARKTGSVMRSSPDRLEVPVTAILMLWGTVAENVVFGWDSCAGVYVLDGKKPWDWPAELTAGDGHDPLVDEAFAKAEAFAKSHSLTFTYRRLAVVLAREVRQGWIGRERKPRRHGRTSAA